MKTFKLLSVSVGLLVVLLDFEGTIAANPPSIQPCGLELVNGVWTVANGFWCPPSSKVGCMESPIGQNGCTEEIAIVQLYCENQSGCTQQKAVQQYCEKNTSPRCNPQQIANAQQQMLQELIPSSCGVCT